MQRKTQQIILYKTQVDELRDQVDVSQEQADLLKSQVL